MIKSRYLFFIGLFVSISLVGQEISQWRGPDRNGTYQETNLLAEWPEEGPALVWSTEGLGNGYGSVTVNGSAMFATGKNDSIEYLSKISASGEIEWQIPYGKAAENGYPAARTTPTIENNVIYLISSSGEIVSIDAEKGDIRWKVDGFTEFKGKWGPWSTAESPLIVDNKIIYTPGGDETHMVALDKNTGETIWTTMTFNDQSGYVSPILVNYAGKDMIISVSGKYAFGVNAADGNVLWYYNYFSLYPQPAHPMAPLINCNSPIYHDGKIFVTSGYDHTGAMLALNEDGSAVTLAWSQPTLDTHHGGVVLVDGKLYGSNWINNSKGNWVCIDWETGEVAYETEWFSKGSIIYADGMLYCYEERKGNLALVKPGTEGFEVVSSIEIEKGSGQHWAHPVIENGILYMRHGDVLMAYNIRA